VEYLVLEAIRSQVFSVVKGIRLHSILQVTTFPKIHHISKIEVATSVSNGVAILALLGEVLFMTLNSKANHDK
jgi:hypothetical protein